MKQTRKENTWYFGMKVHVGTDPRGLVHSLTTTDAAHLRMGQIEMLVGVIPGGGGSQRLLRMLGTPPALEHILEGVPLTVAGALALGLVHRVVSEQRLLAEDLGNRRSPRAPVTGRGGAQAMPLLRGRSPLQPSGRPRSRRVPGGWILRTARAVLCRLSSRTWSVSAIRRSSPIRSRGSRGRGLI